MKYCSDCGEQVSMKVPEGDNMPRHVCDSCGTVHYQNPKMVVGCLVEHDNKVLLCKRAIEPRYGKWTLPAGFMENAETTIEAARRETHEEAGADVEVLRLFTMFSLPHINQVYLLYLAKFVTPGYAPGSESLEVELFDEADIPWDEMAFPVITESLKLFFADRARGETASHHGAMIKQSDDPPRYEISLLTRC